MRPLTNPALKPDPVTLGAGITAGAGILGGAMNVRGQRDAAYRQWKAAKEAEAYQRERDAEEKRRYDEQQEQLKREWEGHQERVNALRQRYGLGARSGAMPAGWAPRGSSSGASPSGVPGVPATSSRRPFTAPWGR